MAKKQKRKPVDIEKKSQPEVKEFSEKTVGIYKRILKIMSWTVGVCFILIIILHLFNNAALDVLAKWLFRFGVLNLIAFTVFEFIGDNIKERIERITDVADEPKSTSG